MTNARRQRGFFFLFFFLFPTLRVWWVVTSAVVAGVVAGGRPSFVSTSRRRHLVVVPTATTRTATATNHMPTHNHRPPVGWATTPATTGRRLYRNPEGTSPLSSSSSSSLLLVSASRRTSLSSTTHRQDGDDSRGTTSSGRRRRRSTWKVFPVEQWDALLGQHQQEQQEEQPDSSHSNNNKKKKTRVKLIHFLRHAQGTHNVNGGDYRSERNIDARLTSQGFQQCHELAVDAAATGKIDVDCVVTSPLTRCIQTALYSVPSLVQGGAETATENSTTTTTIPFVAKEFWRETVNYNCDRRRAISEIQAEFPMVQFDDYHPHNNNNNNNDDDDDEDSLWRDYRTRVGPHWDTHMESAELYKVAERARTALQDLQDRPEERILVCTHSAFLRCLLNWGQEGGVPQMMPQILDDRPLPGRRTPPVLPQNDDDDVDVDESASFTTHHKHEDIKLMEYAKEQVIDNEGKPCSFETFMRRDFENCEVRSFCLLCHEEDEDD
jgi:broad specificity phosphatase PhoE